VDSVEKEHFSIENTGISNEEKLDSLIGIAANVRTALNKRTAIVTAAIAFPLLVGAILLFQQTVGTHESQRIAKQAYVQALVNNRDFLQYRKDFAQTRDCPVEYFRDLLNVSRDRGDLTAVLPPCEPADLGVIDAQIAAVEKKIIEASR
jgi:hypothetical protein